MHPHMYRGLSQVGGPHILLSGCRDDQTSADAYVDGGYHGAMTYALTRSIGLSSTSTWETISVAMRVWLRGHSYDQVPQLSGDMAMIQRQVFSSPAIQEPTTPI